MKPIKHVKKSIDVKDMAGQMADAAFGARALGEAVEILDAMIKDKNCTIFMGQAGAMIPAGMRNIIHDFLGFTDVFVTTGATLTHDTIEALGYRHYQCEPGNDRILRKKGLDRMYNSVMPSKAYKGLEAFVKECIDTLPQDSIGISDFLRHMGSQAPKDSILSICYRKKIPLFCPALADSGIGLMIWGSGKRIPVLAFDDLKEIIGLAWDAKKKGVFYIGGGVPKNYIQQAMQVSSPADYAVQITVDAAEFGGSSGAPPEEGISWGKLKPAARMSNVMCDATIALPIIHSSLCKNFTYIDPKI